MIAPEAHRLIAALLTADGYQLLDVKEHPSFGGSLACHVFVPGVGEVGILFPNAVEAAPAKEEVAS